MRLTVANSAVFVFAAAAAAAFGVAGFYGAYALLGTALVVAAVAKALRRGSDEGPAAPLLRPGVQTPTRTSGGSPLAVSPHLRCPLRGVFRPIFNAAALRCGHRRISWAPSGSDSRANPAWRVSRDFLTPNVNRQADFAERMAWANEFQRHIIVISIATLPPILLLLRRGTGRALFAPFHRCRTVRGFVRVGRSDHTAVGNLPGAYSCG